MPEIMRDVVRGGLRSIAACAKGDNETTARFVIDADGGVHDARATKMMDAATGHA